MITCINRAIKITDEKLNQELWIKGDTQRAKVLKVRLVNLIGKRDKGELFEVEF